MASRPPVQQLPLPEFSSWVPQQEAGLNPAFSVLTTDNSAAHASGNHVDPKGRRALQQNGPATRPSVPVACVACRSRHLKCDGAARCARCQADGVECSYVKSRRGWKGPRKNKLGQATGEVPAATTVQTSPVLNNDSSTASVVSGSGSSPSDAVTPGLSGSVSTISSGSSRIANFQPPDSDPLDANAAFNQWFQQSHPFLPPRARLSSLLEEQSLPHLQLAIQYVGASYIPKSATKELRDNCIRNLSPQQLPRDGFSVQALILFVVGLHINADRERAAEMLSSAIALALDLGMNRAEFATQNSMGCRIIEESWRRTWWQLYVLDGITAAFNQHTSFPLYDVFTNVPLPCEESEYSSGNIPQPHTLDDYDESFFSPEDLQFSSFTYLIDAVRILGKALPLALPLSESDDMRYAAVELIDTHLVNWTLNLPQKKKELITRVAGSDEVIFQAHMIINATSIMLHRPRSLLNHNDLREVTTCVDPSQTLAPSQSREFHTAKAAHGAENLAKLMKLPVPLQQHSPFFACTVVMASVVHLSYWSFMIPDGQDEQIKSTIKLDIAVLKELSDAWPIAKAILMQVRGVAHDLFTSKKAMAMHMWSTMTGDQILTELIEEADPQYITDSYVDPSDPRLSMTYPSNATMIQQNVL